MVSIIYLLDSAIVDIVIQKYILKFLHALYLVDRNLSPLLGFSFDLFVKEIRFVSYIFSC